MLDFVVVEEKSPYHIILRRPFMRVSQCVISTHYLALKYRVNGVVGVVKGDQRIARICYATATKETLQVTTLDSRGDSKKGRQEPTEKLEEVLVSKDDPSKVVKIESGLSEATRGELIRYLQSHADIFAWSYEDMLGIDPVVACHKLAIRKGARPMRQKRKCFNRKDLNKACPKDSFPLPKIDQLVDSTAGHSLLSFMDTFSGYNQIPMDKQDEESTMFITNMGLFCYRVMLFGLKNAGATYQKLVNKIFKPLIGHTMEVYVEDMITKSRELVDHVQHLEETFDMLRKYRMKLNLEKCAFGVSSGKFLGFLLKEYLGSAPLLSTLREGDELYLYLAISKWATSSVLVREDKGKQHPVYYTSKALVDAETRYPVIEKWTLALAIAARKLRPYFQAHLIVVMTDQPLR
ncbi:uncharacterized protein LOC127899863 [Citrus sinensis]|uniref:uncharacterized protein LOC127899863 n=1 Tax=Citrus sinensis TaxID=2711 RepID=UPI002279A530|nr:uncharacterized protein LOC127899863 [Citrus sinensis]